VQRDENGEHAGMRFRLFGIPVQVKWSFFLVAVLIGWTPRTPTQFLVVWVAVVFLSVLVHELGHALVARSFELPAAITLYALGGYTTFPADPRRLTPGRRTLIAASGSAVGLVVGGIVWALARAGTIRPDTALGRYTVSVFVFVNVIWGLLNWLPIRPLDGGQIFQGLLDTLFPRWGTRIADVLFPLTALAATFLAIRFGFFFAAFIAGFLLLGEVQRWQARRAPTPPKVAGTLPEGGFLFAPPRGEGSEGEGSDPSDDGDDDGSVGGGPSGRL